MLRHELLCDLIRTVIAPVFNNDHFRCERLSIKKTKDLLYCIGQAVLLVMSRDNDGQKRIQGISRINKDKISKSSKNAHQCQPQCSNDSELKRRHAKNAPAFWSLNGA